MKAVVRDAYGSVDVLRVGDIAEPVAGEGEVLVRVATAGVDQGVWHLMVGMPYAMRLAGFGLRAPKNPLLGYDVAGRVEAVGANAGPFRPGDEVFGTCHGSFAEYAVARADRLAAKPGEVSFEQAAATPTSGYTALQAVRDHGKVKAGQRVLIIGAGGGVGTFAVQIAKAYGAEVTGVCGTAKTELVRSIGADHVIDYTKEDFTDNSNQYDFTDIEGSTRLLRELGPERYAGVLGEHRRVLREAFTRHGGVEVDTQGDGFFFAFPTAPGALEAARKAQEELSLPVRMGLHTGASLLTEEGYVGADVHRAARVAACAHGGQVLLSAATATLVRGDSLRDLGEHRLKDLSAPERLYQLGDEQFPPLKSLYRTNLPIPATPFLGRKEELAEVLALLEQADVRLLTLSGPGGTGKTRLALQAAAEAVEHYPDGVFWVALAPLRDSKLVLETARQVLSGKGDLTERIADKSLLLLFDNFEQAVDAADGLPELLAACPNLMLLVTSRELLRVPGEQVYPVPPLEPDDGAQLFLARARGVMPRFVAIEAVPELCARLEQLPLALELAAARVRVIPPERLLERLSSRLDLLKAERGVDPPQRTLRATIEWSHELLTGEEQQLFARLAVFAGGCTLDAAERVCEADLDTLQSLVDKSLVRARGDDRFWMLETIRQYASERLEQLPAVDELKRGHAEYFLVLAEKTEPNLIGIGSRREWLDPLERDHDNLRAAMDWFNTSGESDRVMRFAASLWRFWDQKGHLVEGRRRVEDALRSDERPTPARAKALSGAADMALTSGDIPAGGRWAREALELYQELGDAWAPLSLD